MKHVHIFRPGRHLATDGRQLEFSEADLDAMVAAYNPQLHEAPVVVGHPAIDRPAYGWVKRLRRVADGIEAEVDQLDPTFAEAGGRGEYRKFSACFYAPGAPGNPVPETYYLRHVGALGAQPPAVKGLRSVSFAENEEGTVEFAETDLADGLGIQAQLWRNLREFYIDQHGTDVADKLVPVWALDILAESAREAAADAPANDAAIEAVKEDMQAEVDKPGPADTAAFAETEQLRAEIARLKSEREASTRAAAHASNVAFAEGLVARGMQPVHVDAVVAALDATASATVAFAEGEEQKPLADSLKHIFEGLTGGVSFAESATKARAATSPANPLLADALARGKQS